VTGSHDDLLRRVRLRAADEDCTAAPATPEEVAAAEAALGFALPPLLRRLYREVGNGGFGPGYALLPLTGDGRTAVAEYGPPEDFPHEDRPRGVLPVLDWGCGMYMAVDCLDPAAPVLLYEPHAVADDWSAAWFLDAARLEDWLAAWLDGRGWWDEGVLDSGAPGPQPWADAARRLAGG
jgi:hypothetical protein